MFKLHRSIDIPSLFSRILTATLCLLIGLTMLPAQAQESGESNVRSLLKENRVEEALAAIEAELRERPREGPLWLLKGTALSMSDRKDDAVRLFRKMIQDRMEVAPAYNNLAVIYTERGDFESAKVALEAAIRTKPEYAVALRNLGNVYANLAGMSYKRALQLDETDHTLSARLTHLGDMLGKKFDQRLGPPQFANPVESQAESPKGPPSRRFDPSAAQVARAPQLATPVFAPSSAVASATPKPTEAVFIPSRTQGASRSQSDNQVEFAAAPATAEPVVIPAKAPAVKAPTIVAGQSVPQPQTVSITTAPAYAPNPNVHYGNAEPTQVAAARTPNRPNAPVTLQWKPVTTSPPPPAPAVRTAYFVSSPMAAHKAPAPVTLVSAVAAATAGVYCDGVRVAADKCPN